MISLNLICFQLNSYHCRIHLQHTSRGKTTHDCYGLNIFWCLDRCRGTNLDHITEYSVRSRESTIHEVRWQSTKYVAIVRVQLRDQKSAELGWPVPCGAKINTKKKTLNRKPHREQEKRNKGFKGTRMFTWSQVESIVWKSLRKTRCDSCSLAELLYCTRHRGTGSLPSARHRWRWGRSFLLVTEIEKIEEIGL